MISFDGILSPWLVLPLGGLLMLVVAAHIGATEQSDQPESRKRIRIANGWVMLVALPLLATGFSLIDPDLNKRLFILVWLAAILLLFISVSLAVLDIFNNIRLARHARSRLDNATIRLHAELKRLQRQRAERGNESRERS